ncbi:hypothetical protein AVEN_140597-1 [Araneus ventricosus]|uniref:Uncharacterized protein n=1 Tax=Araneus ventricosus TaxID=182803 RepID=A0A4Y2GVI7_ARAVE|nr:hypothetical protein AVEN_140597-1 [Araneus ventricosus]
MTNFTQARAHCEALCTDRQETVRRERLEESEKPVPRLLTAARVLLASVDEAMRKRGAHFERIINLRLENLTNFIVSSNRLITLAFFIIKDGRGGLAIRSRSRGRRVPGSKPDSPEDTPCMGPAARYMKRPPAGVVRKLGERGASPVISPQFKIT